MATINNSPDITKTEAGIFESTNNLSEIITSRKSRGKIIMLSGSIGTEHIKLFAAQNEYLALTFYSESSSSSYNISISNKPLISFHDFVDYKSTSKTATLLKGDVVRFIFDNGTNIETNLIVGGFKSGKEKRQITSITEMQLLALSKLFVDHIEVYNNKNNTQTVFNFQSCEAYHSFIDGQKLLQIMAQRIIGTKIIMRENLVL